MIDERRFVDEASRGTGRFGHIVVGLADRASADAVDIRAAPLSNRVIPAYHTSKVDMPAKFFILLTYVSTA